MLKKLSVVLLGAAVCMAWGFEAKAADYPYGAFGGGSRGYHQPSQSYSSGMSYRSNSYDPGYRSFSYEPTSFSAGDKVVVAGNGAEMKRGTDVLGNVPAGTEFQVTQVKNGWLGAAVEVDGKSLNGWVNANDVRSANSDDQSNDQASAAPSQETRRFSYEPAPQATRTYRSAPNNDSNMKPWQLQRANPHRAK